MGFMNTLKSLFKESTSKPKIKTSVHVSQSEIDPILKKQFANGLLPGEVLLIDWIAGKTKKATFPKYYSYTYGIDPDRSMKRLIKQGYITEATPVESLGSLKVSDLKEALKTKQLKVSGKKADLITRIAENSSDDDVLALVGGNLTLKITKAGQAALDEYYYVVPAHRNDSKDGIYNVANAIRHVNELDYNPKNGDISWALFQKAYIEYGEQRQYGLMRNVIMNKAMQLKREKRYESALFQYLRVFIFDTSGLSNSRYIEHPDIMMFPQPSVNSIEELVEKLSLEASDLHEKFDETWGKVRNELEFHYLSKDECYEVLAASMDDDDETAQTILLNAYKRLSAKTLQNKYGLDLIKYP